MDIDERLWRIAKKRLGYSDEDLEAFRQDPRDADVLFKGGDLSIKPIVLE